MVKIMKLCALAVVSVAALPLAGCMFRGGVLDLTPSSVQLAAGPAGPFLSLAQDSGMLDAVFADPSTTTLDMVSVPQNSGRLPDAAPAAEVIDKIDVAAPLAPFFGENIVAAEDGMVGVVYRDRETDTKNVLKLAWKAPGATQWNLDVLEPSGDPLSLTPDGKGGFAAAWTSGFISRRSPAGAVGLPVPPISLNLVGRPGQTGDEGFTAYDSITSTLLDFEWNGTGYSAQPIPGGGPVHASTRTPGGRLAVVSWDPGARRLFLHEQQGADGTFSTQTVTVCDGTGHVALLPGRGDSSFVIVFDETRSMGAGKVISQLSVIAPGSMLGARGSRYRKGLLASGDAAIDGFAAVRTPDSLYVLLSQGTVRLLRIPLSP